MNAPPTVRLQTGQAAPPFSAESLAHGEITIPTSGLVHLQFRRFAGCPICNLHLRTFARRISDINAAGLTSVAVFHSSLNELAPYREQLPFPVLGDPLKNLYRLYGVESSFASLLHPSAMWAGMKGAFSLSVNPLSGASQPLGLPASFLIAKNGEIIAAHYGKHADDQWSVDEVLKMARSAQTQ